VKQLIIIRGLPGAGKSTHASNLVEFVGYQKCQWLETDKQFTTWDNDLKAEVYKFDPAKLGEAHAMTQLHAKNAMACETPMVIVSNTFSQKWEMAVYLMLADIYKYDVRITDLFDARLTDEQLAARCKHGVPVEKIAQMRQRWEK
jgi:predicted kinase